jgi:hypothetical protein
MTEFYAFYIEEPDLVFGYQKEERDPKLGLGHFGPYFSPDEKAPSPMQVRIGIVGSGTTITLAKRIIGLLKERIKSKDTNGWLYPDYPGFRLDNEIKCKFINSDRWNETVTTEEIKDILAVLDPNERIAKASDLFIKKIKKIHLEDSLPQVIICALPLEIEEYCGISEKTRDAKRPKFTELEKKISDLKKKGQTFLQDWLVEVEEVEEPTPRSFDLRNSLKGKAMQYDIPTQILRETTARRILEYRDSEREKGQPPDAFAWNFSTGLYYKANGRPWRLARLIVGTCYVGVAFYRNLLNPDLNLETSMTQVFTHTGEGFVLRGSDVTVDKETREPRLTKEQAFDLLADSIAKYTEKVGNPPNRVAIHKTSLFSEEEKSGFGEAVGKSKKDFVTISKDTNFRLLRTGNYPVLRGTVIGLTPHQCLLYTTGYTPRIRTYPGMRVPNPLLITHHGDSEIKVICSEILGLTKLNWNTTVFSKQLPITLEFAKSVGKVLSEIPSDIKLKDHYRYYM